MKRIDKINQYSEILDHLENNEYVKSLINKKFTAKRIKKILYLRIDQHKTFEFIGNKLGISGTRVREIFKKYVTFILKHSKVSVFKPK